MNRVFQFPTKNRAAHSALIEADVLGRIQIDTTAEGDVITVRGAFTERMQHGVYALSQALSLFVEKIEQSNDPGHTSSPALREPIAQPRRPLPPGLEHTDFSELAG